MSAVSEEDLENTSQADTLPHEFFVNGMTDSCVLKGMP